MGNHPSLLYVDFDGTPTEDPESVIDAGLADPRHATRVPDLIALMNDPHESAENRLYACIALTTWGEIAGFEAVVRAVHGRADLPWRDSAFDRRFSVDNTFGLLADAVRVSDDLAASKGTTSDRTSALRALILIADSEYFDGHLEWAIASAPVGTVAAEIEDVVHRGVRRLESGERLTFDLATQLVDLIVPLVAECETRAADLALEVVRAAPADRTLVHAAEIVAQGTGTGTDLLAEYLSSLGGAVVRQRVADALAVRMKEARHSR